MAALFLLLLAVAGGVVVADLVLENTTAAQVTLFHHTVTGHSEGWLLAIAAGLGALVALLLVASVNATKARRVRRGSFDVCAAAWRTKWLRPSLTTPACSTSSSVLRNPPGT
jgi:hypothetical protein